MGGATDGIKSLLAVKIKPRQDGYCDQYIRIFMLKVMMAGALLTGLNWYSDKIQCIMAEDLKKEIGGFVSSACWINGLYVYKDIRYQADGVSYYGIPRDINLDGMDAQGKICATTTSAHKATPGCKAMKKEFFLQYQYMTFLLSAVAVLYYLPYAIFRKVNEDMASLKKSIKDNDADSIAKNYFNDKVNPKSKLRLRILGDVIVKVLYVVSTILAFVILNWILNGGFIDYGGKWLEWGRLKNAIAYDYMGKRHFPKPGNEMLPSFGFCEVHESAQDIKTVVTNKHKFVCEISQHTLYQYIFIIIWFAMITSIIVSIVGLIHLLVGYFLTMLCRIQVTPAGRPIYDRLSLREYQYLEFIRRKSMPLYGNVITKLKEVTNVGLLNSEMHPDSSEKYDNMK